MAGYIGVKHSKKWASEHGLLGHERKMTAAQDAMSKMWDDNQRTLTTERDAWVSEQKVEDSENKEAHRRAEQAARDAIWEARRRQGEQE
jgi:hypothetical protein